MVTNRSRWLHSRWSPALIVLGALAASLWVGAARAQAVSAPSAGAGRPLYLDPTRPVSERVDDLVSRMTMEEKAFQLTNNAAAIPRFISSPILLQRVPCSRPAGLSAAPGQSRADP